MHRRNDEDRWTPSTGGVRRPDCYAILCPSQSASELATRLESVVVVTAHLALVVNTYTRSSAETIVVYFLPKV